MRAWLQYSLAFQLLVMNPRSWCPVSSYLTTGLKEEDIISSEKGMMIAFL